MSRIARSAPAAGNQLHRRPLLASSVALGAGLVCLLGFVTPSDHLSVYLVAGALGLVCFLPAWVDWNRGRLDYFEIIHPFAVIYFLNFGLSSIGVVHEPSLAYDAHILPYIPRAALYALLGFVCLLGGYYLPWRDAGSQRPRATRAPRGLLVLLLSGLAGLAGYLVWSHVIRSEVVGHSALSGLTSLLGQLSGLFLFAWALGWLLLTSGRATRSQLLVLGGVLAPGAALVGWFYLSDKSLAVILVLVPIMAAWYGRRRLPWKSLIALTLVLIFLLFPLYNTYRFVDPRVEMGERLHSAWSHVRQWDSTTYLENSWGAFVRRVALVNSFAIILRDVPRWVPYRAGRDVVLAPLLLLVPRVLWPDKPRSEVGREFGRVFHVVHPLDDMTSVAPSVPGELYWNFDLPGVIVGMALLGAGLRWFYRRFGANGESPVDLAIYLTLTVQILGTEGAFLAALVGAAKILIVITLFLALCRRLGAMIETVPRDGLAGRA